MLIETPLSVEVPPLLDKQKSFLDDSLPMPFGPAVLLVLDRVGHQLVSRSVLYAKSDGIYLLRFLVLSAIREVKWTFVMV